MAGDYQIDVQDFGPIVEASVDVRPLTVFIGPSNTGKSYLAILLYALHQCFGSRLHYVPRFLGRRSFDLSEAKHPVMADRTRKELIALLSDRSDDGDRIAMPAEVTSHIRSMLAEAPGLQHRVWQEISRCFGTDGTGEMVRHPGSQTSATVAISAANDRGASARYHFNLGPGEPHHTGQVSIPEPIRLEQDHIDRARRNAMFPIDEDRVEEDLNALVGSLADVVFRSVMQPLHRDAHYLPADRTGVMHSHQMVVSTLFQNAATAGIRPSTNVPMLSGVLADFLDQLIRIDRPRRIPRKRPGRSTRTPLDDLLGGEIRVVRNETGYPTFIYNPDGWDRHLPLMRSSSMVSELAPVLLYVRHVVRSDDVLIIEEPEAHLHPAMQAAFARELARLVHSGIRVVMTTHSEWFLEQIGNLVRASALPPSKRAGIRGAEIALRPDQVGAWLFKPKKRPKGSVVEEITLDTETGLFPTDYDEVSGALYNEGATIFNRLQEGAE